MSLFPETSNGVVDLIARVGREEFAGPSNLPKDGIGPGRLHEVRSSLAHILTKRTLADALTSALTRVLRKSKFTPFNAPSSPFRSSPTRLLFLLNARKTCR
jgi:hypothetical protein